jgi:hypothetical protein
VRRFRRHPRFLLPALLALVAQVVVPIFHVHGSFASGYQAVARGVCVAQTPASPPPASCPDHDRDCPLCTAISAATTFILPALIAILTPVSRDHSDPPRDVSNARPNGLSLKFQARAPPALIEA